jgi:RNA-directed DNA polymerase
MDESNLYSAEIWERFANKFGKTEKEFVLKTYPQFDPFFNFFHQKEEIHELVKDPTLSKVAKHSFIPFVKILTKTPRYRFQEQENSYSLDTKIRPISFASHFDSYLYSFYSFALTERYQEYIRSKGFSECVLAYRTDLDGKCNIQFAKETFDDIRNRLNNDKECTAIALDVTGYFDNINHETLKDKWCKILNINQLPKDQFKIFKSLTKYNYVNKDSILKHFEIDIKRKKKNGEKWQTLTDLIPSNISGDRFKEKFQVLRQRKLIVTNLPKIDKNGVKSFRGIPQGSPMSALLSNIYLIDFDDWLFQLSKKLDFTYKRYCDDLLIICKNADAQYINKQVIDKITKYDLRIQEKKTELIEFKIDSKGSFRSFNRKKINQENAILSANNEARYYKNLQYLGFEFNGSKIYIRPGSLSKYFRKLKGRVVKTIMMAYSDKSTSSFIFKRQIIEKYSHLGKRNFLTYVMNASKKEYSNSRGVLREGMNSISIKRQISSHFSILIKEIEKTSKHRATQKAKKGKEIIIKL